MHNLYYVIYSPAADLYVNDEGGLGSYAKAAQFGNHADAEWRLNELDECFGFRIVGPCIEGETP